ncbi:MAG: CCA tRNA nucleotidyltransferase [Lachnospiraceae bacterium]|nr:CCA tRNA nucleotidyltransferase [Lachnospiraceae bacterium]
MLVDVPKEALEIIKRLNDNGYEAYVVGGCVRDSVLGKTPSDWDICTSASADAVICLFADHKVLTLGIKYGTVTVFKVDDTYEVSTFRTSDYADNQFDNRLYTDLSLRDFTINAMAYDSNNDTIIDPFGGLEDLERKTIRCVGNDLRRLNEDHLRKLRALRFASELAFDIEEQTADFIHKHAEDILLTSAKRITAEISKLLLGKNCINVLCEFSDVIATILPELKPCIGFNQNNPYHCYDVYEHIVHAVGIYEPKFNHCNSDEDVNEIRENDLIIKYALLFHDIGKPMCYTEDSRGGHFYGHSEYSVELTKQALKHLRLRDDVQKDIIQLVKIHDDKIQATKKSIRKWISKIGKKQFERYIEVHRADVLAHSKIALETSWGKFEQLYSVYQEVIEENSCMSINKLAVNGRDLMNIGMKQGKEIGITLNKLLDAVINEEVENTKEQLIEFTLNHLVKN